MTAYFLVDAWRFCCGVFRFTQFDLSLHSGKAWGTVVENLFRPSECVADGGSFDSVRLTPHCAHDDSAFFDRRMAISPRGLSIDAIRRAGTPVAPCLISAAGCAGPGIDPGIV